MSYTKSDFVTPLITKVNTAWHSHLAVLRVRPVAGRQVHVVRPSPQVVLSGQEPVRGHSRIRPVVCPVRGRHLGGIRGRLQQDLVIGPGQTVAEDIREGDVVDVHARALRHRHSPGHIVLESVVGLLRISTVQIQGANAIRFYYSK